jgi:hypothetical protein
LHEYTSIIDIPEYVRGIYIKSSFIIDDRSAAKFFSEKGSVVRRQYYSKASVMERERDGMSGTIII